MDEKKGIWISPKAFERLQENKKKYGINIVRQVETALSRFKPADLLKESENQ